MYRNPRPIYGDQNLGRHHHDYEEILCSLDQIRRGVFEEKRREFYHGHAE
jgi:hypothetical protein